LRLKYGNNWSVDKITKTDKTPTVTHHKTDQYFSRRAQDAKWFMEAWAEVKTGTCIR